MQLFLMDPVDGPCERCISRVMLLSLQALWFRQISSEAVQWYSGGLGVVLGGLGGLGWGGKNLGTRVIRARTHVAQWLRYRRNLILWVNDKIHWY